MTKYRSKPVEIEAFRLQWAADNLPVDYPAWFQAMIDDGLARYIPALGSLDYQIKTANGWVRAEEGDWIIREPSGIGCYPCKDGAFQRRWELIPEPSPAEGWIEWNPPVPSLSKCPVDHMVVVDFWRRNGEIVLGVYGDPFNWGRYSEPRDTDIIAYRLSEWMQQA